MSDSKYVNVLADNDAFLLFDEKNYSRFMNDLKNGCKFEQDRLQVGVPKVLHIPSVDIRYYDEGGKRYFIMSNDCRRQFLRFHQKIVDLKGLKESVNSKKYIFMISIMDLHKELISYIPEKAHWFWIYKFRLEGLKENRGNEWEYGRYIYSVWEHPIEPFYNTKMTNNHFRGWMYHRVMESEPQKIYLYDSIMSNGTKLLRLPNNEMYLPKKPENCISRFIEAQDVYGYETIINDLKNCLKGSWVWFTFPQERLGDTPKSVFYSLKSRDEVIEYWETKILKERLVLAMETLLSHDKTIRVIVQGGDLMPKKVHACCVLFSRVTGDSIFKRVLDKFFYGLTDFDSVIVQKGWYGDT